MGNSGSHQRHRRRRSQPQPHHPQPPQPELTGNRYGVASSAPYPAQYQNPNPNSLYYPGYYPIPPVPFPYGHHHRGSSVPDHGGTNWVDGQIPYGCIPPPAVPYVEHQKAVTIHNDVNLKKGSLRVEQDEENPGRFLVAFTFDAIAAGSITVIFFAKEDTDCNLMSMKESVLQPVTVSFQPGIGQKFRQPSGTGIDFSMFKEVELLNEGDVEVYPLAVKAEAYPLNDDRSEGNPEGNSQITLAAFEKQEKGEYQVRVKNQFLWVNGMRYELQEIYGIGSSVDGAFEGNEPGKECVICLSEPQDTTVLPCRHMCMCSGCAKVLRFQTTRCPICRQPVERFLEIKVSDKPSG